MKTTLPSIARIRDLANSYDAAFYTEDSSIIASRKRYLENALRDIGRVLNTGEKERSRKMATREQVLELLNKKMAITEIAAKLRISIGAAKISRQRLIDSGQYHPKDAGLQWPLEFKDEQDAATFITHQLSRAGQVTELEDKLATLETRCSTLQSELDTLRNRIKEVVS